MMNRDVVRLVRRYIDLQSYSNSSGFAGFFECRGRCSRAMATRAIELVLRQRYFGEETPVLVTNLFVVGENHCLADNYDLSHVDIEEYVDLLVSERLLTRIPEDEDCWARLDGDGLMATSDVQPSLLTSLFVAAMTVDGVRGHCFAVSANHPIAVYPHEDCGFGFVSMSDHKTDHNYWRTIVSQQYSTDQFRTIVPS